MKQFAQDLKKRNNKLGSLLGVKKINVDDQEVAQDIEVKRYIKVIAPNGGVLPMTPKTLKAYVALGLSLRNDDER